MCWFSRGARTMRTMPGSLKRCFSQASGDQINNQRVKRFVLLWAVSVQNFLALSSHSNVSVLSVTDLLFL